MRLLERAAAAANVACDGVALDGGVVKACGGVSLFVPGGELKEMK